jgi:rare lipoprotein A
MTRVPLPTLTKACRRRCLRLLVLACALVPLSTGCIHQTLPDPDASELAALKKERRKKRPAAIPGYPKPYKVLGRWYQPIPSADGFQQEGIASWYGPAFHGRSTSTGEKYDMYGVTAAHKTLPLNTWVRVYNLENRRYLDMRINDRGPFVPGRIIDLSYGAALRLGVAGNGLARVRVVALGAPARKTAGDEKPKAFVPVDYRHGNFTFQVGAFKSRENAERLLEELADSYEHARVKSDVAHTGDRFHRVLVGRIRNLEEAEKYEAFLRQRGFSDPILVAE